jgi:hypothetical protein
LQSLGRWREALDKNSPVPALPHIQERTAGI